MIQILVFFLLTLLTTQKEIQHLLEMPELQKDSGWLYIGKMSLSPGSIEVKLTTQKISGNPSVTSGQIVLNIIPQSRWQQQQKHKCTRPIISPIITHQLLLDGSTSISDHTITINESQMHYFVLKDCGQHFNKDYNRMDLHIQVHLQIINNGNYMGEEEDHWLIIPLMIGVGMWILVSNKRFLTPELQNDPDYAKMIAFATLATNMSSLVWRSFGYLIYRNFGTNYLLFHCVYLFMHSMSQTLAMTLLVLVAMGWSINYLTIPKIQLTIPIGSLILSLNVALTLLTQLSNSQHDMHHTFDAGTGPAIITVRLLVGIAFLICCLKTYNSSRYKVREFMIKFAMVGSAFIFGMPIIVLFANRYVPVKDRNQFVFISIQGVKSICNIYMVYMLSSSKSQYNKLSYRNASFLPNENGLF